MEHRSTIKTHATPTFVRSSGFIVFCLLLLITTVLTWTIGLQNNRYEALTLEGFGEVFPAHSEKWDRFGKTKPQDSGTRVDSGSSPVIISPAAGAHTGTRFVLDLPELISPDYSLIRIRTIATTLTRASNRDLKTDAGILLHLLDNEGEIIDRAWVARLTGEFDTHRNETLMAFDSNAHSVRLHFTSRLSDGSFSLDAVDVDIVKLSMTYEFFFLPLLLLMWAALFFISARYVTNNLGKPRMFVFVGTILFLVAGILLPTNLRDMFVSPVFDQLASLGLAGSSVALVHYYKAGHFLIFFLVSFILFYNARRLKLNKIDLLAIMSLIAIATEGAQLHLFFRSTQALDVAIDMAGVFLALLLYYALRKVVKGRKVRRSKRQFGH